MKIMDFYSAIVILVSVIVIFIIAYLLRDKVSEALHDSTTITPEDPLMVIFSRDAYHLGWGKSPKFNGSNSDTAYVKPFISNGKVARFGKKETPVSVDKRYCVRGDVSFQGIPTSGAFFYFDPACQLLTSLKFENMEHTKFVENENKRMTNRIAYLENELKKWETNPTRKQIENAEVLGKEKSGAYNTRINTQTSERDAGDQTPTTNLNKLVE